MPANIWIVIPYQQAELITFEFALTNRIAQRVETSFVWLRTGLLGQPRFLGHRFTQHDTFPNGRAIQAVIEFKTKC